MKAIDHWRNLGRWCRQSWPYALLAGGSLIFLWPFVWMLMTSMKLDREMFASERRLLPLAPAAPVRSPYLNDHLPASGAKAWQNATAERLRVTPPRAWPDGVDVGRAEQLLAHALTPSDARGPGEVTPRRVRQGQEEISRLLVFGTLLARGTDLQETVLVEAANASAAWTVGGPARAGFRQHPWNPALGPVLAYDFASGNSFTLDTAAALPFAVADLQRLQLFLQPDDSWHALECEVEMAGRRYRAERPVTLFDTNWLVLTWQRPGPDDVSGKRKTWLLLNEVKGQPTAGSDDRTIRVRLTFVRRGLPAAWWAKITRNYLNITDSIPFARYVATSIFLVTLQVVCTVLSCSLVAYSFARLRWPGRAWCLLLMLGTLMIPSQVTMIPQFLIIRQLGWYDTLLPLWVPSLGANAFFVFLLYQFMKGIPVDLEDAARLDGCGILGIYWNVALPLLRPALATVGIFTFMGSWNDFMGPLIYVNDQRLYPLSLGLYALSSQNVGASSMGLMMAGSLLMTLPVIVIFLFAQRYFIQGVALTGIKG